jgi:small-conductance mechanosensitive channel
MNAPLLQEVAEALSEGLARPVHFWAAVVIVVAVAGGVLFARWVHARARRRLETLETTPRAHVDALRFSIEGVRRLAFPLAVQLLLWIGEVLLRLMGIVHAAAEPRLLRLAMTLFGAMALIRFLVYAMQRAFGRFLPIAPWERLIAATIWLIVALHLTGVLADLISWLEATRLPLGKTPLSLWALISGTLSVVVTLLVTLWIGSSLEARLMRAQNLDMNLRVVVARFGRAVLIMVALLLGLSFAGLDLTVLSVFGGALGVGLGLGLQKIASNYVSGFIILLDRSLRIGDMITVDKHYGAVSQINTRYTVIKAGDGTEAIVPNEMLISLPVTNHSLSDRRVRVAFKVSISYEADLAEALRLLVDAAVAQPRVLKDPAPAAFLTAFGADGLELEVGFWIQDPEEGRMNVQSDTAVAVLARFRAAGIAIPFPQRDVRIVSAPAHIAGIGTQTPAN